MSSVAKFVLISTKNIYLISQYGTKLIGKMFLSCSPIFLLQFGCRCCDWYAYKTGTFLKNYFGQYFEQQFYTRDFGLPMQLGCKQSRQCLAEYRRKILIRFIQKVPETIVTFGFLTPQTGCFWNVANIYHNFQQIYTFSPRCMYTNFNLGSQIAHIIYIAIFCVIQKSL